MNRKAISGLAALFAFFCLCGARWGSVGVAQQAGREQRDQVLENRGNQLVGYFVDATNGDDSNSGDSIHVPWKTLGKVAASQFAPGTKIYLKRGTVWREDLAIPSSGVTIDAYGSGALPIIDGSTGISGWLSEGGGIYSKQVVFNPGEVLGNISENGIMMSFVPWNADFSTTFSGQPTGTYSFHNGLIKVYIKPASNPSGNSYLISRKIYGISAVNKSDVLIQNLRITRFSLHGIEFQNCQRCSVANSTLSNGGGAVIAANPGAPPDYLYAGNGIQYDTNSSVGTVDNVTIDSIFDSGISPQTFASNHTVTGIQIQNSTVEKCGFAGVEISVLSNGGSTGSQISNITVSGMTIQNSGKGWSGRRYGMEGGHGIRIIADTGAGTMSNISLQTSVISGSAGEGVRLGGEIGNVVMNRLKIKTNNHGILAADGTATTLKVTLTSSLVYGNNGNGFVYNAPSAAGFKVFQNTFYANTGINLAVLNQSGNAQIQNNIFYSAAPMAHLYVQTTLVGPTVNNNCYNDTTNMFGYNGTPYSSVGAFRSALGFEVNGLGGNVNLTNPGSEDFTLQPTSQCRDLGSSAVGVSLDYSGRAFRTPPSSGAYEY